jgi:hypothetical protein
MKRLGTRLLICSLLCLGIATSCNNNSKKQKEPQISAMDSLKDSLKHHQEEVNNNIQSVQKSMSEVDKEFKTSK